MPGALVTLRLKQITIPLSDPNPDRLLRTYVANALDIREEAIRALEIRKKSLDARRKARLVYHYQVDVDVQDEPKVLKRNHSQIEMVTPSAKLDPLKGLDWAGKSLRTRPVIVGSGPAGTFAALVLAQAGQPPIIIERGEAVEQRHKTVGKLRRHGQLTSHSNYCFGEGGAGTFSDGKLTCGRNHPLIRYLFEEWVRFGAPKEILFDAHPHIGTDYLMRIAKQMRVYLESLGTTYRFGETVTNIDHGGSARMQVTLANGDQLDTDNLVLAIGHSARSTYEMLHANGIQLEQKPFAMGARFEHPQEAINKIQYGTCGWAPPAEYKLAAKNGQRGVWTFCMCPGGHLLPTSAEPGHLAINGMSYHARNSGFANAAVVVNVRREDYDRGHPLDGMRFQQQLEQRAFQAGGGGYYAPGQRLTDFLAGRDSKGELASTYRPGVVNARMDKVLPAFITSSLQTALKEYNQRMRGFITDTAIVAGLESKTSAPVVMPRGKTLQSVSHPGLYPTGEGAGFAGGIVSAALDGVRVGTAVVTEMTQVAALRG